MSLLWPGVIKQHTNHFYVWPVVWCGDLQVWKSMVIHDTECLYWDQVSQNSTQTTLCVACCLMWWFASLEKYGHTWHWMSLLRPGVIIQHKTHLSGLFVGSNEMVFLQQAKVATFSIGEKGWVYQILFHDIV